MSSPTIWTCKASHWTARPLTYNHETGHALGLGHSGDYPIDFENPYPYAIFGVDNEFANDSWQTTTMSCFHQDDNHYIDADFAVPVTPMVADIIAIQNLYGIPADINSENTEYGSNSNVGSYLGELFACTRRCSRRKIRWVFRVGAASRTKSPQCTAPDTPHSHCENLPSQAGSRWVRTKQEGKTSGISGGYFQR